ncbi:hypothetical protein Zmor_020997 [Zophobas morio]|uniref:Uncharacterized protein n=1 Tax=Zophobas morio TaxID=2755281 RepID=A0AA38I8I5_9CUCU|nr:hypothetical protein Zmor_020997 [Zophobas morio]
MTRRGLFHAIPRFFNEPVYINYRITHWLPTEKEICIKRRSAAKGGPQLRFPLVRGRSDTLVKLFGNLSVSKSIAGPSWAKFYKDAMQGRRLDDDAVDRSVK